MMIPDLRHGRSLLFPLKQLESFKKVEQLVIQTQLTQNTDPVAVEKLQLGLRIILGKSHSIEPKPSPNEKGKISLTLVYLGGNQFDYSHEDDSIACYNGNQRLRPIGPQRLLQCDFKLLQCKERLT